MPILRNVAPRIYLDTDPYVDRIPTYNEKVFYPTGAIVSQHYQINDSDSDTVFHNFYVANRDIVPFDGSPEANSKWTLYVAGDPRLANLFTDSEVYDYVDAIDSDYKVNFSRVDSDITLLTDKVKDVFGFDSDIREIRASITEVEEKNIIDSLTDSDARDGHAIAWDAAASKFKFVNPVLSVNNTAPDSDGNISVSFTKATAGSRDERPDSDTSGSIFVIIGDSDSSVDGTTYSFTDIGWVRVIGYTELENDILYVNKTGDTMTGPLLLSRDPVLDSEAATKSYVDGFNDSDKQDRIIMVENEVALAALTYETDRLYYVHSTNEMWVYHAGALSKFSLTGQRVYEPTMLEATVNGTVSASYFLVTIDTYRFSNFLEGTLSLRVQVGGTGPSSTIAMAAQINVSATIDVDGNLENFKLVDSAQQTFTISAFERYDSNNKYFITFVAHDGKTSQIELGGPASTVEFDEINRTLNFGEY